MPALEENQPTPASLPSAPTLGKIIGESNAAYHATDALSNSKLSVFRKRPLLYWMQYVAKTHVRKSTAAFDLGIAFHARCEGLKAYNKVVVVNDRFKYFRTDAARDWRDLHQRRGRTVLSREDGDRIMRMVQGFKGNPTVMALLRNTEREVTWRHRVGNYLLQCRTDRWCEKARHVPGIGFIGNYVVDFKSVPHLEDWEGHVGDYGYHLQERFYQEVITRVRSNGIEDYPRFFFVVTEKEAPWCTEVFEIDPDTQIIAGRRVLKDLQDIHKCYESGVWPGNRPGVQTVGLKYWRLKQEAIELGIRLPSLNA